MENTQKLDIELINKLLVELKPNISSADRKEAPASVATVIKYLNGYGEDIDMGMTLLLYFRKRIEDRRKILVN